MCTRKFFSLSVAYANERVSPETSDSVLSIKESHAFKMKQDGRSLENKTPREIINMDRKTEFKI